MYSSTFIASIHHSSILLLWHIKIFSKTKEEEKGDDFHTVKVFDGNETALPDAAKECITKIIPLESFTKDGFNYTKCDFQIETGRQHQIRAQSSFHGHPLAGDTVYGAESTTFKFDLCDKCLTFPANNLGIPQNITIDFD